MTNFENILLKLESFIRRFHTNDLIKGSILFFSIGLLYFLFTLLIEHFLWLDTRFRTLLFWVFIIVETLLFIKFIAIPLSKLFKLQKGIDYQDASKIIGNHFPDVNDKLLNVLQLKQNTTQTELLLASIEQKSVELNPIPFKLAINFNKNVKYLKYAAIPILLIALFSLTGHFNWFSDSYERVVNYKTAYEPPAPFQFFVVNENLDAIENKEFKLNVKTVGDIIPENASITYNNETYFLQQISPGNFEYSFALPRENIEFHLTANEVRSKPYTIQVIEVPTLLNFEMFLDYPAYTRKNDETLKSTGNALIPQGTNVVWKLKTKSTDDVKLYARDTIDFANSEPGSFETSKRLNSNLEYSISTSNKHLKDYENLSFSINVIRDEYPELNVQMEIDSLDQQSMYFYGQISDDYGINKLDLVYYPIGDELNVKREHIPISKANFDEFVSAFPNNLTVEDGVPYELYFQVFDNDVFHKYKSVKSAIFTYRKLTKDEEEQKQLQEQSETIDDLNKSLEKFDEREKELKELAKIQKEKSELNFNDKKKFEEFLKRQQQQEQMMQNFNKKLKENLEEFQKEEPKDDQFKEDLKERLKENEEQLKKDEKLLEELEKLREKMSKEELSDKLEKLAKQNKNQKRSLEQLLELTKRYYVTKKLEKLQQELEELAKEQDKLAEESKENNTKEKQDKLNEDFKEFQKQMEELQKDNKELKQPIDLPQDKPTEKEINEEQKEASEQLDEKEKSENEQQKNSSQQNAKKSQKSAAKKMKKMSGEMQQSMQASGGEQMQEDMEMLRQILDNLVLFSFDEEALMNKFKSIEVNHNKYATYLRKQSNLREHFSHIDDSLFALSLRQPKISEIVNKEISEVFFSIDKALEQLSENRMYQGIANQQYTITAANNLADFLSNTMDSMQMQMDAEGQGQGQGPPKPGQGQGESGLPDIIKSQEELNKEMEEGVKKGEKGKPQEGEEGKEGKDGKEGENGEKKEGKEGSKMGEGEGSSEDLNGQLYEIYQRQQQIRQALQDRLAKQGNKGVGNNLLRQMENIEMELLNKGFTNKTLSKMMNLQHQLLKMENATFQQGEDNKRKSDSNKKDFDNTTNNQIQKAKQYFNTTEILNRQALPLQQVYKKKVQEYFKSTND